MIIIDDTLVLSVFYCEIKNIYTNLTVFRLIIYCQYTLLVTRSKTVYLESNNI